MVEIFNYIYIKYIYKMYTLNYRHVNNIPNAKTLILLYLMVLQCRLMIKKKRL